MFFLFILFNLSPINVPFSEQRFAQFAHLVWSITFQFTCVVLDRWEKGILDVTIINNNKKTAAENPKLLTLGQGIGSLA